VVGVNAHTVSDEAPIETHRLDPELERKQLGRVEGVRARRDATRVEESLGALRETAAHEDRNLMPGLVEAARAHATEGEIVEALQEVFGTYTETPVF